MAALATRQYGVVAVWQLDLSRQWFHREVRAGRVHRLHRGVYAVGHLAVGRLGTYMAAVLACGPAAVLSHRAAADLWGMRRYDGLPEVTLRSAGVHSRRGMHLHRSTSLTSLHVTRRHGIPVTTPERTIQDLADVTTRGSHQRALATAERLGLVDRERLTRAPGRRQVVVDPHVFTRSRLERELRGRMVAAGLPAPEANQDVLGWEVDLLWRAERVVVEIDVYATHRSPEAFERDRRKQNELEDAGYRVRRITPATPLPDAVRWIRRALSAGRGAPRR